MPIKAKNLALTLKKQVITFEASFETGEITDYEITMPYDFIVESIETTVKKALAATNAGTITTDIGGTAITGGVVTIAASSTLGTKDSATPTAANEGSSGAILRFTMAKATVGGKAWVNVIIKRK